MRLASPATDYRKGMRNVKRVSAGVDVTSSVPPCARAISRRDVEAEAESLLVRPHVAARERLEQAFERRGGNLVARIGDRQLERSVARSMRAPVTGASAVAVEQRIAEQVREQPRDAAAVAVDRRGQIERDVDRAFRMGGRSSATTWSRTGPSGSRVRFSAIPPPRRPRARSITLSIRSGHAPDAVLHHRDDASSPSRSAASSAAAARRHRSRRADCADRDPAPR